MQLLYIGLFPNNWHLCSFINACSHVYDHHHRLLMRPRAQTIWIVRTKSALSWNLAKSRLPTCGFLLEEFFWNFAQSTAVILPYSVQNCRRIHPLKWANEIFTRFQFKVDLNGLSRLIRPHVIKFNHYCGLLIHHNLNLDMLKIIKIFVIFRSVMRKNEVMLLLSDIIM